MCKLLNGSLNTGFFRLVSLPSKIPSPKNCLGKVMNCFLCLNRNQNSVLINHAVEIPNSAAHRIKCNLMLISTSKFLKDLRVFV